MDFAKLCSVTEEIISKHKLFKLDIAVDKNQQAIGVIAKVVPSYYADPKRIAMLLKKLGKPMAAAYVEQKLPTKTSIRSGDLGEILCNAYVYEATPFDLGVRRLRWKDHRNMSMRGEDVLAFNLDSKSGSLRILKAEVKSRASMKTSVIDEARSALCANSGLPSPHALAFVADRLNEAGETVLGNALDKALLKDGIRVSQVSHMLFTFSGNDPLRFLRTNLQSYAGPVTQHYVGFRVEGHQNFIKAVFALIGK